VIPCPLGKLIAANNDLVVYGLHTVDNARLVGALEPYPKARTQVETVVVVLGANENIRVEQVCHQRTPSCSASPSKVDIFLIPRSRIASV
jgi:hypothetical protein